jgi:hypothetical protein
MIWTDDHFRGLALRNTLTLRDLGCAAGAHTLLERAGGNRIETTASAGPLFSFFFELAALPSSLSLEPPISVRE